MREPPAPVSGPPGATFTRLVEVMDALLAPDGCPWDREQTLASLRPFLLEETYEVLDALEGGDPGHHCEELGDLLMQIVFQAALQHASFGIDDVVAGIVDKLVRRHPHVFGDATAGTSEAVLKQWNEIKKAEKAAKGEGPKRTLAGVSRGLPALARAQQLGSKAGRVGFDWGGPEGSLAKVREEVGEVEEVIVLRAADAALRAPAEPGLASGGSAEEAHWELGDLLFACVNLARKLGVDAETALHDASARFTQRFELIEDRLAERGKTPEQSNLDEMDALWNEAKRVLASKQT